MVTTKLKLSMTEPQVRQIYAKQGDTGRVLDITLDQTPEDGTLRILRPDGVEVTSEAVTGGEISESGETVSFESLTEADVTELTVGIEPVQDLNGYDKPWVGGAGKNKLNMDALQIGKAWNGDSNTARAVVYSTCQPSTQYTLSFSGSDVFEQILFVEKTSEGATSSNRLLTATSPFTFTTNATSGVFGLQFNKTAIASSDFANFKAQIETGSTATAWQPYSNICPITGHDEVTVFDTAEQMYDPSQVVIGRNWTGGSADNRAVFEFVPTPNISYEVVTVGGNFSMILFMQMNGGAQLSSMGIPPSDTPKTITIAENCNRVIIQFNKNSAITTSDFLDFECSVSTKTTTYTASLGQTVYGGTLDMVSGVLTVDSRYLTVDDFARFISGGVSEGGLHWVDAPTTYPAGVNDDTSTNVCSHAPYSSAGVIGWRSTTPMYTVNVGSYPARIYVDTETYADFQTKYATLQAVYKLAEPQTYQLTPQQIKTLVGTNNVWASSGQIVNIKFTYGGMLSELPSDATSVVGKCYCDVEQNGVSSMPFTLNVKKNERQ